MSTSNEIIQDDIFQKSEKVDKFELEETEKCDMMQILENNNEQNTKGNEGLGNLDNNNLYTLEVTKKEDIDIFGNIEENDNLVKEPKTLLIEVIKDNEYDNIVEKENVFVESIQNQNDDKTEELKSSSFAVPLKLSENN